MRLIKEEYFPLQKAVYVFSNQVAKQYRATVEKLKLVDICSKKEN
jgi:hypothetical protein